MWEWKALKTVKYSVYLQSSAVARIGENPLGESHLVPLLGQREIQRSIIAPLVGYHTIVLQRHASILVTYYSRRYMINCLMCALVLMLFGYSGRRLGWSDDLELYGISRWILSGPLPLISNNRLISPHARSSCLWPEEKAEVTPVSVVCINAHPTVITCKAGVKTTVMQG
jgi:hypothetical protein